MFRWCAVRYGHWYHRRCLKDANVPSVRTSPNSIAPPPQVADFQNRKFGLEGLDAVGGANLEANIVATLQAGCFFGSLGAYWFADKYGRRSSLFGSAILAIIGTILQVVSNGHLPVMYVGRFVMGLGTGAASMLNPLYTSENAPRAIRGALTGMYQFFVSPYTQTTLLQCSSRIDCLRDLRSLLDQLQQSSPPDRGCTVHHLTCTARSPRSVSRPRHAHQQRIPPMACPYGSVGEGFRHPFQSP
jgi:hypothetical protein